MRPPRLRQFQLGLRVAARRDGGGTDQEDHHSARTELAADRLVVLLARRQVLAVVEHFVAGGVQRVAHAIGGIAIFRSVAEEDLHAAQEVGTAPFTTRPTSTR